MPPVGFEPTISAGERPQTYALDRAATGTGIHLTGADHKIRDTDKDHTTHNGKFTFHGTIYTLVKIIWMSPLKK